MSNNPRCSKWLAGEIRGTGERPGEFTYKLQVGRRRPPVVVLATGSPSYDPAGSRSRQRKVKGVKKVMPCSRGQVTGVSGGVGLKGQVSTQVTGKYSGC